jgi:predicted Rossmann fold flavoprotein
LFAHKGVSGPAILNASLYWEKGSIGIDFLPDFSFEKIQKNSQKQITTLLPLPKNFTKAFLDSVGLVDKRFCDVDEGDMQKLSKLKNYEFAPAGTFGLSKAEITKGGVATADIDPDTMESRFVGGLYFVGEVLDVNGELGGYNFHFAFASAAVCAKGLSAS